MFEAIGLILILFVGAMLTRDIPTPRRSMPEALYDHFPMAAGVQIFAGSLVEIVGGLAYPAGTNGGGYCVFATEYADNRTGAAGDLLIKCEFRSSYLYATDAPITRADQGQMFYAVDDQTVSRGPGAPGARRSVIGHGAHWEDTDNIWVEVSGPLKYGTAT